MPEPPPAPEGFPPGAIGAIPEGILGPEGPPEQGLPQDPVEMLRLLIDGVKDYMDTERDEEDLVDAADILRKLQKLIAKQQKEQDQAMGVGPAQKFLRRNA